MFILMCCICSENISLKFIKKNIRGCRKILSDEALKIGLTLKTVDDDKLFEESYKFAQIIAKQPANTLRYSKRLLKMGSKLSLDEFLDFCALFQGISHNHKDHKNAVKKIKVKK